MLEGFIAGAIAATIGVVSSHGLSVYSRQKNIAQRIGVLEQAVPTLIRREEVQAAFQEMAQIEGRRQAEQQQFRAQEAFGMPQAPRSQERANLNAQINDQLSDLTQRISAINDQFGPSR